MIFANAEVAGAPQHAPGRPDAVDATAFTGRQSVTLLQMASIAGDFASVPLTCPRYDVRLVKTDRVIK